MKDVYFFFYFGFLLLLQYEQNYYNYKMIFNLLNLCHFLDFHYQ